MTAPSLDDLAWPRRTERLLLRRGTAADAAPTWPWRADPEVSRWLNRVYVDPADWARDWEGKLPSAVVAERDGVVVGTGKIHVEDAWGQAEVAERAAATQAEIGWVLDPAQQGRGLGTELARGLVDAAFALGLRRVVAYCFAGNTASWTLMERLGMRREAHFVAESLHRDGTWQDGFAYALLAAEHRSES